TAQMLDAMAIEEAKHRGRLFDLYREKFGDYLPLIRRSDVRGFQRNDPIWLAPVLSIDAIRDRVEAMEQEAGAFYKKAAAVTRDASVRQLLNELADIELQHEHKAGEFRDIHLTEGAVAAEKDTQHRKFVLTYVQPGLAGLMDGSVSTLAPIFAAAFATHNNWETFLIGMAASIGAGISMGFTEALSDDGEISGRGSPWVRGVVCGLMTTIGGLGHVLPYLIPDSVENAFWLATGIATLIVFIELWAIAWIRAKYMDTPFLKAAFQVVIGGVLVFIAGILIGSG
ncbi:MAG TPA: ferritin family protein, partial [Alphaproteobacteria bacterium]|nr:ferritin family protein [Alphaproteobacteria bacterium]